MNKTLNVVSISSEVAPYSKSGGLADVSRSLPKAIKRLGHNVIVITPLYGGIIDTTTHNLKLLKKDTKVKIDKENIVVVSFWKDYLMDDLPIYFIENKKYFSKRKVLYGSKHENVRFLIFDLACLELIRFLDFKPDIIHCHDWQTGLIPHFIKKYKKYKELQNAKTVFTIHNLVFQLGQNWWEIPLANKDHGKRPIPLITDPDIENINFAKRAIMSADVVNTVSEQYKEEIMTKHFGQNLHMILRNRQDRLFGIINGIDYKAYNPTRDPGLIAKYSYNKIHRKKLNKEFLQKKLGFKIDATIPLITMTSRVTYQKGFELFCNTLEHLVRQNAQYVIMGDGDKGYIKKIQKYHKKYPHKIIWLPFKQKDETKMYAGSDFFLLPSHHEPCGINQLIAMRYGCVPIVREVGGLNDTVENYNAVTDTGTGFTFNGFNEFSLFGAIIRSLETFKYKYIWRSIMVKAMKQSSSWTIPAKKYITLYYKVINR
ncbi:glycogen synthase [Patescibacteria group bacterium]|nr:glycogen synthase [Patescibacteria group bacterium]